MMSFSKSASGEILIYEAPDGSAQVDVRLDQETAWLSLNQIAELFGREKSVISRHLRNLFDTGEVGREGSRPAQGVLQPGHHSFGRLSGEFKAWHPVPPVGNPYAPRAPGVLASRCHRPLHEDLPAAETK